MVELTAEERAALEPAGASQDLTPEEQAALAPAGGASGLTPEELAALQPAGQGLPLAPSASPMISQAAKDEFGATGPGFMLGLGGKALQSVAGAAQGFEQMISDPTTLAQRTVWNPLAAGLSQATVPLFGKEVKQIPMPERYQQIMQGSQGATNIPAVDTALGGAAVGGRAAADLIMSGLAATGMSPAAAGAAFGVPAVLGMTGLPEGIEKTQSSLQDVANEQIRQLSAGEVQGWDAAKANLAGAGAAALSGMGQSAMEVAPLALGVAGSTARQGAAVRPEGTVVPPVEPGAYPMAKGPGPGNSIPGMLWDATAGKTAPGRWLEKQVTPSLDVLAQKSPQTAQAIRRQQEIGTLLKSYQDELFTKANALDPFSDQRVLQLQRSVPPARFGKRDAGGALVPEEYARLVNDPAFLAKRMQEYELDALRTLGDDTMAGSEDLHRLAARYVAFNRISEDLGGLNTKQLFNAPLEGQERRFVNKAVEASRPAGMEWEYAPKDPTTREVNGQPQTVSQGAGYAWRPKDPRGFLTPEARAQVRDTLAGLQKELTARTRNSTEEKFATRQRKLDQVARLEEQLPAPEKVMPLQPGVSAAEAKQALGTAKRPLSEIRETLQEGVPQPPEIQGLRPGQVSEVLKQGLRPGDRAFVGMDGQNKVLRQGESTAVPYEVGAGENAPLKTGEALGAERVGGIPTKVYHGTPHTFDEFSLEKVGTGEGRQAYGHGMYFAEREGTSHGYRTKLSQQGEPPAEVLRELQANDNLGFDTSAEAVKYLQETPEWKNSFSYVDKQGITRVTPTPAIDAWLSKGNLYAGELKDTHTFLDYDNPPQPGSSLESLRKLFYERGIEKDPAILNGKEIYRELSKSTGSAKAASALLGKAGIPGMRYLDKATRSELLHSYNPAKVQKTHNFVVWDQEALPKLGTQQQIAPKTPMRVYSEEGAPTFQRRNEVQPLDMPATPAEKIGLEKAAKQLRASVEGNKQKKTIISSLESFGKTVNSAALQDAGLRMKRDALLARLKENRPWTDADLKNTQSLLKDLRAIADDDKRLSSWDKQTRVAYVDTIEELTRRTKQAGAGYSPQVNKEHMLAQAEDLEAAVEAGQPLSKHASTFALLGIKMPGASKVQQRKYYGNEGYIRSLKHASAANAEASKNLAMRASMQSYLRLAQDDPTIVQPDLGEASNKLLSKGWVRIEDNPRVPKLLRERYAGRLIHEDLARALYDTEPNKLSKLVSEWSKWVAVGNPGSSVANAAGSIALTDLYFGISPLESATKGGFTGLKALKGRYQEELRRFDFGSLGSDEIQAQKKMNLEMAQLEQAKEAYRLGQQAGDGFFGGLLAATTAIDKGLAKAAEGLTPVLGEGAKALSPNDLSVLSSLFEKGQKAFIYETLRDQGYTMDQAAAAVRKGMVDYGDFSRFETAMRNYALGGFGSRFAKFTTASMRNAIQVALNPNPRVALRFWKYPLAIAAWNDAVQQANGESDDDRVQREVQGWAGTAGYRTEPAGVPFTFGPQMFRVDLPTGAEPATPGGGKEVRSVDLYRWVPGNMGLDIVGGVEAMQSGRTTGLPPVLTRFAQLNPGAQTLMELASGKDLYTGEQLTEGESSPTSPYNLRRIYNAVSDVALPVQLGRLPNRLGENEAMLANPLASNFRRTRPERNDILAAQALGARVQTDNPAARKLAAKSEALAPMNAGLKFLKKGKTTVPSRLNVQQSSVETTKNRVKALFPRSEK